MEVKPEQIVAGEGVATTTGIGFTDTIECNVVPLHPLAEKVIV